MTEQHTVELRYDGQWNDITSDVREKQVITISRGHREEAAVADPGRCQLTLNNRAGQYSPRNPRSKLFEKIGRNTPLRVRVGDRAASLALPGARGSYASTPDDASLDITGDIDVRVDIAPDTWRPVGGDGDDELIISKWADGDASWALYLTESGTLKAFWSVDGSNSIFDSSTASIPDDGEPRAVRWTLDVDNGAGGNEVRFYTADSVDADDEEWSQLGDTKTGGSTTSIFSSDAPVEIGSGNGGGPIFDTADLLAGRVRAAQIRDGIGSGGTVVADLDLSTVDPESESVTDDAGLTWTLHGQAWIVDPSIRFVGEVSAWPSRWDTSGADVWVPIEAAGILRRLRKGDKPLRSSLYRDLINRDNVAAYWPLEDGRDATVFRAARGGGPLRASGDITPADSDNLVASDPVPTFNVGRVFGSVEPYVPEDDQRVMMYVDVPDDGVASGADLMDIRTTGTAARWLLRINESGSLRVIVEDSEGDELHDTGWTGFAINGSRGFIWVLLEQDGSDIDWQFGFFEVESSSGSTIDDTLTGETYGAVTWLRIGTYNVDLQSLGIGHIQIHNGDVHAAFWDTVSSSLIAWRGEPAGDRMIRLAGEEGVPLRVFGHSSTTARMGAQRPDKMLALFEEGSRAEIGILGETREATSLAFRPRRTLYNQTPKLVLDYSSGEVFRPFEPIDDDRDVSNDVTVRRPRGGEARAVLESGPISVQAPPDGVGRYDESPEINVESDAQLPDQAAWRLHLGTVDEPRFKTLRVNLANPRLAGLVDDVLGVVEGDRVQVINTPDWLPPGPVDLIVRGSKERKGIVEHEVTFNCTPASPWHVAVVGETKVDTAGSELDTGISDSAMSMDVATTVGETWNTDPAEFPFDVEVGGEEITISEIGPASGGVQTFTISSRSVNGVTKSHNAGTTVRLSKSYRAVVALQ